jgi:hypothetical protein
VADGWCWFVLREEYCWLVVGGWFVLSTVGWWLISQANRPIFSTSFRPHLNASWWFFLVSLPRLHQEQDIVDLLSSLTRLYFF